LLRHRHAERTTVSQEEDHMERVDLVLLAAVVLVAAGLWLAVGVPAALISVGVALAGYWFVLNLDDDGDTA
jgi:hypothetical protein